MEKINNMLLYDAYCPMCNWYSSQFIKYGFIKPEERVSYQEAANHFPNLNIDFNKAKNEIAFYNATKDESVYGVDSLLNILFKNQTWLIQFFRLPGIYQLLKFCYGFISYNRKIFAPSTACNSDICYPDKSWPFRFSLIMVTWVIVSAVVGPYFFMAYDGYLRWQVIYIDALVFFAQFMWQILAFKLLSKKSIYDYLGHLSFVSLVGALLLGLFYIGLSGLKHLGLDIVPLATTCFGITLGIMLMLHIKRVKENGYNSWLTWSWILFRISACFVVFKF